MIELDPKRSFAVQKAEHEVRRLEGFVRAAEEEFNRLNDKLQAAYKVLDDERAKDKK